MRLFGPATSTPPPAARTPFGTFQHVVHVQLAPALLRLAYVALVVLGGAAVLFYVAAWTLAATPS